MRRSFILSLVAVFVTALTVFAADSAEPTTAQNKAKVRQFYEEVFNPGKADLADAYFAVDAIDHQLTPGQKDPAPALANCKAFLTEFRKAFPDFKVRVEDLVAEGDKVVARARITGTHTGDFFGAPATGKTFSIEFVDIVRLKGGRFAEHWGVADESGLMQQLGITPPPAGVNHSQGQSGTK